MHKMYLGLFIFAFTIVKCFSIQCYTCEGLYSDLNNQSCSIISRNDSCYTTIGYAVDTGNWLISMDGFNATADFPGAYVKPKSGSAFFDQFWSITNDVSSHQLWMTRYFCYKDFCNPLSIVQKYINSILEYPSYTFQNDVTQCLICNASDYNAAEKCDKTKSCKGCTMTANQTVSDLYSFGDWSSDCLNTKMIPSDPEFFGSLFLQYEIDTELLNIYAQLDCTDKVCTSFDFMKNYLKNIKLTI